MEWGGCGRSGARLPRTLPGGRAVAKGERADRPGGPGRLPAPVGKGEIGREDEAAPGGDGCQVAFGLAAPAKLADLVDLARKACGCAQCFGGDDVEVVSRRLGPEDTYEFAWSIDSERALSCVARVALAALVDRISRWDP